MKTPLKKTVLFLAVFMLLLLSACGGSKEEDTPVDAALPTAAIVVETAVPPTPTDVPVEGDEPPQFYTENFDGNTNRYWTQFLVNGQDDPALLSNDFGTKYVGPEKGSLLFDLQTEGQRAYVTYEAHEYDNVKIDITANNQGANNNNVIILCRYTPEVGWYEFNISNGGLYWIYYAEIQEGNKVIYNTIANGGSNNIKMGKEINQYSAVCNGETLTLYINGVETNSVNSTVGSDSGFVGVSVWAFDSLPIKVGVESITISQP